jgi:hypothetical protein
MVLTQPYSILVQFLTQHSILPSGLALRAYNDRFHLDPDSDLLENSVGSRLDMDSSCILVL